MRTKIERSCGARKGDVLEPYRCSLKLLTAFLALAVSCVNLLAQTPQLDLIHRSAVAYSKCCGKPVSTQEGVSGWVVDFDAKTVARINDLLSVRGEATHTLAEVRTNHFVNFAYLLDQMKLANGQMMAEMHRTPTAHELFWAMRMGFDRFKASGYGWGSVKDQKQIEQFREFSAMVIDPVVPPPPLSAISVPKPTGREFPLPRRGQ